MRKLTKKVIKYIINMKDYVVCEYRLHLKKDCYDFTARAINVNDKFSI